MRVLRSVVAVLVFAPGLAAAQSGQRAALTPLETLVACAPPTTTDVPSEPLHVVGSQDPVKRFVFDTSELLVLDGGSGSGLQLGQQFYIRRPVVSGVDRMHPKAIRTLGWLTVVSLNDQTAIARVDHFCDAITTGDYLEPFVAPSLPADVESRSAGEPDFSSLGRVLNGPEDTSSGAVGGVMMIDRGSDQQLAPGARFSVYRDLHTAGMPLTNVGEGVVLSVGKSMSLMKITRSRDAIVTGDYVVPRK